MLDVFLLLFGLLTFGDLNNHKEQPARSWTMAVCWVWFCWKSIL